MAESVVGKAEGIGRVGKGGKGWWWWGVAGGKGDSKAGACGVGSGGCALGECWEEVG